MENQLLELIKTRRSCRHYKAEQVSDKELNAVLEAGEYAPTGHGLQDHNSCGTERRHQGTTCTS